MNAHCMKFRKVLLFFDREQKALQHYAEFYSFNCMLIEDLLTFLSANFFGTKWIADLHDILMKILIICSVFIMH